MPLLSAAPAARVVTVGTFAAESERLDPGDPAVPEGLPAQARLRTLHAGADVLRRRGTTGHGARGEPMWHHLVDPSVAERWWGASCALTGVDPGAAFG